LGTPAAAKIAESNERVEVGEKFLLELPPKERETVESRREGVPVSAIAKQQNVTERAIEKRLKKVEGQLRRILGDDDP
jgi:DNA-directed RNA polymerase specialized sigma24 family protein